jgi:hypothetical protein
MNRLTRQDILHLLEDEKVAGGVTQKPRGRSRAEVLNPRTPSGKASYMVYKKTGPQEREQAEVHHDWASATSSLGKNKGRIEHNWPGNAMHGKIAHRNDSVETVPYYRQLKEACAAWWCGTTQENMIDTFDNTDKSSAAYSKAVAGEQDRFFTNRTKRSKGKGPGATGASSSAIPLVKKLKEGVVASARRKGAANLRTIGEIVGQIPDPRAKLLKSGADFQAGIIDSPKNEDTMTGDIGSVEMGMGAVPLRGMGPADEEDRKRRGKKRRKMATLMGIATGSVNGIGN